jgi:hypothetical protein
VGKSSQHGTLRFGISGGVIEDTVPTQFTILNLPKQRNHLASNPRGPEQMTTKLVSSRLQFGGEFHFRLLTQQTGPTHLREILAERVVAFTGGRLRCP